jgi:IS4 transposase
MLNPIFERFAEKSPLTVIARGMMERVLDPEQLDQWFDKNAKEQYTKDLLFSSVFDIMSQVVCGNRLSVNAAYQAAKDKIGVSITSVYNKLNGIEAHTSAELVRYAARQVSPVIKALLGKSVAPLPGYRLKLLDGNCIKKSEHRIKELRTIGAGPLPGKSLVVYDPVMRIPIDVFPCEDGHAQERSLLHLVLLSIVRKDAWVADRNFCTTEFTCGIDGKGACFIIREHKKYPWTPIEEERCIGKSDTGTVYERRIRVIDEAGKEHEFRRIRIRLKKETRDGDKEIAIITNVPKRAATGIKIAELYQGRWKIETAFQELATFLNSEITSLGYPRAALFGFCVALVSYMILSVVKAALVGVHGEETVEKVSSYYMAEEISATYRGMMIAIPDEDWAVFRHVANSELLTMLRGLSVKVKLSAFRKHPRGPKKPAPKRISSKKHPHVSTAKILAARKK